jgi:tRNA pseudouridine55 synthase
MGPRNNRRLVPGPGAPPRTNPIASPGAKPGPKPGAAIDGLLVIDKPVGLSSARVVAIVRRKAGGAKVGHAGTLDPLASGILLLGLGRATRHLGRLMNLDKRYETTIDLSAFTTTDDREGPRTEVMVAAPPPEARVREALRRLTGTILQRPPAFSAMKVGGRRAYKLARRAGREGQPPPILEAREVVMHSIELLSYDWPMLSIAVHCGKGTYIRALARQIGEDLGTGGHCAALRRTAVGAFDLSMARTIESLPATITREDLVDPVLSDCR